MNNENIQKNNNDFPVFLRTILMILENHNFSNTATIFKTECDKFGYTGINSTPKNSPKKSPKVILQNFALNQTYRIIIENNAMKPNETNNEEQTNDSSKMDQSENKNAVVPNVKTPEILVTETISDSNSVPNPNCMIIIESVASTDQENSTDVEEIHEISVESDVESTKLENENFKENSIEISTKHSDEKMNNYKINDYEVLKDKFSNLQSEHHKLMNVVTELTYALQTSIKGQIEDTSLILNNCEKIYPELFCNKTNNSFEIIEDTVMETKDIKPSTVFVNNDLKTSANYKPFFNLDFQKIKHDLTNSDLNTKLILLQALRWRITKSIQVSREEQIRHYIRYDLLNIHNCSHRTEIKFPKNSIVFTSFYCTCKSPQELQRSVARFVNALASIKIGRDYIIHQSVIPNILLSVLLGTHPSTPDIDDITRDMIIATLQKISLRYSCRMIMILEGLTEYMIKFLSKNLKTLNDYCLEYSAALLRNLWLHKESREKCHPFAGEIFKIIINLLNEQYYFCLPYIIGSLYNLIPDEFFHNAAKRFQFEDVVLNRITKLDGEMKDQLQYILEIYLNPESWQPLCECDLGSDGENELDIVEPEIDQNDSIENEIIGEEFLLKYRLIYSFEGAELNPNYINNLFSVPVTPNINARAEQNLEQTKIHEINCLEYAAEFLNEQLNKKLVSITNQTEYKEIVETEGTQEINNKKIEMTFCEDTQQFYYLPTKNGIFEPDETYNLHSFTPSFFKNIGDNISKSLPVSPRNNNVEDIKNTKEIVQYLSTTANYSGMCYRAGLKPKSFSDTSSPYIGFCNENNKNNNIHMQSKYSCSCLTEMQRSFEDEIKPSIVKNNNETANNNSVKNEIKTTKSRRYCKYKSYPSNSAPTNSSSIKKERETGSSKSLDETDYTAVFESRPRILRTP